MNLDFFRNMSQKSKLLLWGGVLVVCLLVAVLVMNAAEKETPAAYTYESAIERKLAEDIKEYLGGYFTPEEADIEFVANEGVLCYRTILKSGTQSISNEHTEALNQKMRKILEEHTPSSKTTYADLEALASGICKIILDTLLGQLEESALSDMNDYQEEYLALTASLQAQINALKKRSTNINLTARIKNNKDEISKEVSDELSNELSNAFSDRLSKELSNTKDEIYDNMDEQIELIKEMLKDVSDGEDGKTTYFAYAETSSGGGFSLYPTDKSRYIGTCVTADDTQPTAASSYSRWTLFVGKDGVIGQDGEKGEKGEKGDAGKDGKNGKAGKDGIDGENGVDGKDGQDGINGKTTYFAYAEDMYGSGFSLRPTAKTKYIGTCITDEVEQPKMPSDYSNWQIITGQDGINGQDGKDGKNGADGKDGLNGTDGKTTYFAYAEDVYGGGFSLRPTAKTKYIGTCITDEAMQPTTPYAYSNWQVVTGQDGADGKDGENGADGKTTYVAYADNKAGDGFSLVPTETSKYIGTCATTDETQPTNAAAYGNWQLYRNYIITSATDENNNTTLYIQ